jgi:hypothetical protein
MRQDRWLRCLTALALATVMATLAHAQGYERRDVTFVSEGLKCAACYYVPVKAVVSQVPAINGWERLQRFVAPEQMAAFFGPLAQDRAERMAKGAVNYIPVVAPAGQPSSLPTQESYDWFMLGAKQAPNWINKVTARGRRPRCVSRASGLAPDELVPERVVGGLPVGLSGIATRRRQTMDDWRSS